VRGGSSWFLILELSNPIQSLLVFQMKKHIEVPKFVQGLFVEGTAILNVKFILNSLQIYEI
jgi:hypothetical protein